MKNILLIFLSTLLLVSCERPVDFSLKTTAPKLVVEATIENDQAPLVVLSSSLSYFSEISTDILANSFVHGAQIVISNGSQSQTLKEYSFSPAAGYQLYYYTTDTAQANPKFLGAVNTKYSLDILVNGEHYTASTTIPNFNKQIDSIWWKPAPFDTTNKRTVVTIKVTDPKGFGDYVRYYTKRNNEPYFPGAASVYDDQVIDGTTYDIAVEPGYDRNADMTEDERSFKRGDTVTIKLSSIDKATFDFWRTMEYSYSSIGNPFSTPVKVINNISNNALGYFGGYASQYRTIIIPK